MQTITFQKLQTRGEYNVVDQEGNVFGRFRFLREDRDFPETTYARASAKDVPQRAKLDQKLRTNFKAAREKFPELAKSLTQTQFGIFAILHSHLGHTVHTTSFLPILRPGMNTVDNTVAVHMVPLRKKLEGTVFEIVTDRAGRVFESGYRLVLRNEHEEI